LSEEFFGEFWNEVKSTKMKWVCLILEHYSFIPTFFNLIYVISFLWNKYVERSYIDLECLSKSHFESMLDTILMNKWMGLLQFVWKHFEIYKIYKFCLNFQSVILEGSTLYICDIHKFYILKFWPNFHIQSNFKLSFWLMKFAQLLELICAQILFPYHAITGM
jgi:hypothetical protein